jgi:hypothetical protein
MNLERLNHLKNSGGCLKELDHLSGFARHFDPKGPGTQTGVKATQPSPPFDKVVFFLRAP